MECLLPGLLPLKQCRQWRPGRIPTHTHTEVLYPHVPQGALHHLPPNLLTPYLTASSIWVLPTKQEMQSMLGAESPMKEGAR